MASGAGTIGQSTWRPTVTGSGLCSTRCIRDPVSYENDLFRAALAALEAAGNSLSYSLWIGELLRTDSGIGWTCSSSGGAERMAIYPRGVCLTIRRLCIGWYRDLYCTG